MRTTLTLNDEVTESIRRMQKRENLSFRESVDQLLRAGLYTIETKPAARPYKGTVFNLGLQQGIDANRLNQLADEFETELFHG